MATSIEVAKLAGVSQATVSRVLNGHPNLRKETKDKVLKAIEELNYRPNLVARSLVMNKTKNIVLVSGTLKNPFFVETTDSIVRKAREDGYNIIVHFENIGINRPLLESILSTRPDGIILSSIMLNDPILTDLESSGIPYIMFNRRPHEGGNYVVMDNQLASQMITEYLIELGHRRIAFISGHLNVSTYNERKKGFELAMSKHSVAIDDGYVRLTDATEEEVSDSTLQLIGMECPPTAIICASDFMALNCMDTLLKQGVNIPKDISICGIDDAGISAHSAIELTTIGPKDKKMGVLSIENLIQMIESEQPSAPLQIVLRPELKIRKTAARPD